jgi:hypothetical protein
MNPTENTISQLMWVTWYNIFHCNGTVCLALDCAATLVPTAFLLLHDVTIIAEMMYLPSYCLAIAIFCSLNYSSFQ